MSIENTFISKAISMIQNRSETKCWTGIFKYPIAKAVVFSTLYLHTGDTYWLLQVERCIYYAHSRNLKTLGFYRGIYGYGWMLGWVYQNSFIIDEENKMLKDIFFLAKKDLMFQRISSLSINKCVGKLAFLSKLSESKILEYGMERIHFAETLISLTDEINEKLKKKITSVENELKNKFYVYSQKAINDFKAISLLGLYLNQSKIKSVNIVSIENSLKISYDICDSYIKKLEDSYDSIKSTEYTVLLPRFFFLLCSTECSSSLKAKCKSTLIQSGKSLLDSENLNLALLVRLNNMEIKELPYRINIQSIIGNSDLDFSLVGKKQLITLLSLISDKNPSINNWDEILFF